jgi:hypothetical protein
MRFTVLFLTLISYLPLTAQTASGTIQTTGNASVNVTPDQAQLTLSVVTNGSTAQAAAQQNATLANAVIAAVTSVLGTSGTVQTVGYSIYPQYSYGAVVGYSASNSLLITTTDLTLPGKLIDAASQAGANNVGNLTFGLQNPDPPRQQALTAAAKVGLAHAAAIAAGLGAKAGAVVSAEESSSVTPVAVPGVVAGAAATPVVSGTVSVSATVTVTVQLTQ